MELCHRNEPLNVIAECMNRNMEIFRPHLAQGIAEMLIPPVDPLVIPKAALITPQFNATFEQIEIYNVNSFVMKGFKFDPIKLTVDVQLALNNLRIMSNYAVTGRILVLDLDSRGRSDGNYSKLLSNVLSNAKYGFFLARIDARMLASGRKYLKKNNKEYVKWKEDQFDVKVIKAHLHFNSLFGHNEELNEHTNLILNQNIDVLLEELLPVIKSIVSDFLLGLLNRIFARFPFDQLFPLV